MLTDNRAKLGAADKDLWTFLDGNDEIAEMLVKNGANVDTTGNGLLDSVDNWASNGRRNIVQYSSD